MPYPVYKHYYELFEDAPLAAAIFDASSLKLEIVNSSMLNLWQRPPSIQGSALLDFLPELANQEYPQILKNVAITGNTHCESGARVMLNRQSKIESVFMDYSYKPISINSNRPTAILVLATDVCEREMNNLNLSQSKRDLRALVMSAPVPMCIYRDAEFKLEAINDLMLDLWQGSEKIGDEALNHVYHNGVPYTCIQNGITYSYSPLRSGSNSVNAICVMAVRSS